MSGKKGIVGRLQEQEILEKSYESNQAEFIAVYGRRRVGKTFLIRQYFTKKQLGGKKGTSFFEGINK